MERRDFEVLLFFFFVVLAFRLFFAFQSSYFTADSYFNIREITQIKENFVPFFDDALNGRSVVFVPGFHYLMAFFAFFLPAGFALKVLPNLFAASLVFVVYLICFELTKDRHASFLASFVSGFVPVFVYRTVNSVSPYGLVVPLTFFALYCFMKLGSGFHLRAFIVSLFILSLLSPAALLLVFGLLFYFVLVRLELLKQHRAEPEILLFSVLFVFWVVLLFFKRAFLAHGFGVVTQNLPLLVVSDYFSRFNILGAIYGIGLLPFFFGVYVLYLYLFREHSKNIYLFIALGLTALLLLMLRLISIDYGLMFLGVVFCVLLAPFYRLAFVYLKKTRFAGNAHVIAAVLAVAFILTSVFPSVDYANRAVFDTPRQAEYDALVWLRENTNAGDVILSAPSEGFLVSSVSGRRVVIDDNYFLMVDSSGRFEDVKTLYTTPYETNALALLSKYGVNYVVFSRNAVLEFGSPGLAYASDADCFDVVYNADTRIYRSRCALK